MSIFVRARFHVHDGRSAEFEQLITSLAALASDEPGTLTYRWFGPAHGSYVVIEEYADTPAALAHNERAADLLAQVPATATMVSAELYGTLGPELIAWASARPEVSRFPLFPGTS